MYSRKFQLSGESFTAAKYNNAEAEIWPEWFHNWLRFYNFTTKLSGFNALEELDP